MTWISEMNIHNISGIFTSLTWIDKSATPYFCFIGCVIQYHRDQWVFTVVIYLNYLPVTCLFFFSFSCLVVRSSLEHSTRDKVAYEVRVPGELGRNISLAQRGRVDATAKKA